ncbi:MAG: sigma-E factor negative regulatory protein [Rudaea sp.]
MNANSDANVQEQLSALMDGELSRDETRFLLRRLDADTQLARSWSNYQTISDVMKHRFATPMRADFAATVLAAIGEDNVTAVTVSRRGGLLRWAGGGAIAAAVAVFALTTTRSVDDSVSARTAVAALPATSVPSRTEAQLQAGAMPVFPVSDFTQPASYDAYNPGLVTMPRYLRSRNEAAERLNDFGPYVLSRAPQPEQVPAGQ